MYQSLDGPFIYEVIADPPAIADLELVTIDPSKTYIHSLPSELLALIFEASVVRFSFGNRFQRSFLHRITPRSSPATLIQVCARWRALAFSLPSLWNALCPSANSIARMKRWLEVAPKFPFHLQLVNADSDNALDEVLEDDTRRMLWLFGKISHRWLSLSLLLSPEVATDALAFLESASESQTPLPITELSIRNSLGYSWFSTISGIMDTLQSMPNLQYLELTSYWTLVPLESIPWSRLKICLIHARMRTEEAIRHISQCSTAIQIEFQSNSPAQGDVLPLQRALPNEAIDIVSLPNLTSLNLGRSCDPIGVLKYCAFPSLVHLQIHVFSRNHGILDDFLTRAPKLKSLLINDTITYLGPGAETLSAASDDEILQYLISAQIGRVPTFRLTFRDADVRGKGIVQNFNFGSDELVDEHLRVSCWKNNASHTYSCCVGWGDAEGEDERMLWSYQDISSVLD